MMDPPIPPAWFLDSDDEERYSMAQSGRCPADNVALQGSPPFCRICRRVFAADTGTRVASTWYSGALGPNVDEMRSLLVRMLRSAKPHPVEHPTMWRAWGDVCACLGLNADDYRIPSAGG